MHVSKASPPEEGDDSPSTLSMATKSSASKRADPHKEVYDAFAKNVTDLSSNLLSIAKACSEGAKGDKSIEGLPGVIQIVENWLLNLTSRPDLLVGYAKRVYVNKRALDEGDGDALIDDEEYFYGDVEFARPYAPLFTILWKKHMTAKEKARAIEFFKTYNAIVEDWISDGAAKLFADPGRAFDRSILERIQMSLLQMDTVPEEKLMGSKQLADHYKLLGVIRKEFLALRNKAPPLEEEEEDEKPLKPPSASSIKSSASTSVASKAVSSTSSKSAPSKTATTATASAPKVVVSSKGDSDAKTTKVVSKTADTTSTVAKTTKTAKK